jgi:hypothetical protein
MTAEAELSNSTQTKLKFAERFDDWLNPIVVKELRQAVQSRFVITALLVLLAIQIIAVAIYLMTTADISFSYDAGRTVFIDSVRHYVGGEHVVRSALQWRAIGGGALRDQSGSAVHHDDQTAQYHFRKDAGGSGVDRHDLQRLFAVFDLHLFSSGS